MCHGKERNLTTPILDLNEVSVRREAFSVRLAGLSLDAGSVVLAGPNGSGKSTLLSALAGLLPWDGVATVAGQDVRTRRGQSMIGFLPQDPRGVDHLQVGDAINFARDLVAPQHDLTPRIDELGLKKIWTKRIRALSGGQRRLAYLAMAVVHDPPLILLDEPTVGIDASHRAGIRAVIRSLSVTSLVITTSHLPDDIAQLGDRTLVMRSGSLVFDATSSELQAMGQGLIRSGAGSLEAALAALESA